MMEMVERVALAIATADCGSPVRLALYLPLAKVAIAAMREPTEAMVKGGEIISERAVEVWQDMIDEALS